MFAKRTYLWFLLMVLCFGCESCMSHAQREAETVVAQADSLWQAGQMYGIDAGDSASLAQAYETLNSFVHRTSSLGTFSHACYHYGKLLRAKDNPVEAMRVFIDATHSGTRDYHILGRVYSNMGSICHLAGEFPLSYDMYKKSAQVFLQGGDTLLYYYDLNNMAFELAEQGKKEEAFALLSQIDEQYPDTYLWTKIWETKADAYLYVQQYDSSIYCINKLNALGYNDPTCMIIKAQAYDNLGEKDSALFYAETILDLPYCAEQDKYNMLYIILNYDTTLANEELLALSACRSDIETDVLIPLHNQWAVAVQLLEQDIAKKLNLNWLYSAFATLLIIGICIGIYVYKKHKKRILLSQQVDELESKNEERAEEMLKLLEEHCSMLRTSPNLKEDLCWKDYDKMCAMIDKQFNMLSSKICSICVLNEKSFRLCILTLLNVDRKTISDMLPYALSSIGKLKDDTAKSLGTTGKNLRNFLLKLVIK